MDRITRGIVERQLSDRLADAVKLAGAMTREEQVKNAGAFLDLPRYDLQQYSLLRAIKEKRNSIMRRASSCGDAQFTGVEADCHLELVKRFGEPQHQGRIYIPSDILYRDLQAANAGSGGYLVGSKNLSFIDRLRNRSVAYRLGAQPMPGQRENLTIPKGNGGATVTWLSNEMSQAIESTPTFVQVAGSPKTAAVYVEISQQLLDQGGPAGEAIVQNGLSADLAVGVDAAVINGSGAAGQPLGILSVPGIGTASGASLGYAGLVGLQKTVAEANALLDPSTLGYVTTPTVADMLKGRQRFTGTDSPLWRGALHEGQIEGLPAFASKNIPTATMLYGDWSSVLVPEWGVLALEVNPFADFKALIVGVRALWSIDVLVQHPTSFVAVTSIT